MNYNSKYMIDYLADVIRPLVLILLKLKGYVKRFKDENQKFMSLCIAGDKPLEKYETLCAKIEGSKNIELSALPVYDERSINTEIRKNGDNVYSIFCSLYVPEDGIECESLPIISIDYLLFYENNYCLQVYLNNFPLQTNNRLS